MWTKVCLAHKKRKPFYQMFIPSFMEIGQPGPCLSLNVDTTKHTSCGRYCGFMKNTSTVCLSAAENKPIWMHAEEREEMSKVRRLSH